MAATYVDIEYKSPPELPAKERIFSFEQVVQPFSAPDAQEQAMRCVGCDNPGCNSACSVAQDLPGIHEAVAKGNWRGGFEIARSSYTFGLLSPLCSHEVDLCQAKCTVGYQTRFAASAKELEVLENEKYSDTIANGGIETAVWRHALDREWLRYDRHNIETGHSIGIIGAGVAGIYFALAQREIGNTVTVYDLWPEIGGLLYKGIPDFKIAKEDLPIVRRAMEEAGVKFELNSKIGNGSDCQHSIQELMKRHHDVVIASGTYAARKILHPETKNLIEGHHHIIGGLDYLFAHNDLVSSGKVIPSHLDVRDKTVVILGTRDTAHDCIRTAIRAGAAQVFSISPGPKPQATLKERIAASEEAEARSALNSFEMHYHYGITPLQVGETQNGRLDLLVRNRNGQGQTNYIADFIISAAGFYRENLAEKFGIPDLVTNQNRTTSYPNLYVVGDALTGATLAVRAAGNARDFSQNFRRAAL